MKITSTSPFSRRPKAPGGFRVAEKVLLLLSRHPTASNYRTGAEKHDFPCALDLLCRVFPGFLDSIAGKRVLDFGCGDGYQTVALVQSGAAYALGLDTSNMTLSRARALAASFHLGSRIDFAERLEPRLQKTFDLVISQNSFEHFGDPVRVLEEMKGALKNTGAIFLTFGPPWFAPYGSHMHFFTKVPWVNILFSEKTVMSVRRHFRNDGATRYEEVEGGLNRMTVAKFERIISASGLKTAEKNYECVKGLKFLGQIPWIRELFVNRVSCVLRP